MKDQHRSTDWNGIDLIGSLGSKLFFQGDMIKTE